MKKIILVTLVFLIFGIAPVLGNELLVLSGEKSQNSMRWKEEVFPEYSSGKIEKSLSVTIVPIQGARFPEWINKAIDDGRVGQVIGTPTFIIWDDVGKRELGRVEGYTQKQKFYDQLNEALAMIAKGLAPGRREGSGGHMREGDSGADHRQEGSGGHMKENGSGGNTRKEGSSSNGNLMEHIYKTQEEAKQASEALGLGGETHSHETPQGTIFMPGSTM